MEKKTDINENDRLVWMQAREERMRKRAAIFISAWAAVVFVVIFVMIMYKHVGDTGEHKVKLGDYEGIEINLGDTYAEVTDEAVEEYAGLMVSGYNQSAKSDRTVVEDGDTVYVSITIYLDDGSVVDDGRSTNSGFITIGSGGTYEDLEQGLIGAVVGESLEIPIMFPDPYEYNESLSGVQATGRGEVMWIREEKDYDLGSLTDEQAHEILGTYGVDSVEGFYDYARGMLEEQNTANMRSLAYSLICRYLLDVCSVGRFPEDELAARVDKYMEDMASTCSDYYGMTLADYCAAVGMTEEEYRLDVKEMLSETLTLELIFTAIGDREGIQYDEDEYQSYIEGVLSEYGYGSAEELYAEYGEDYVKNAFRIEYIIDWLIDNANIIHEPMESDGIAG